MNGTALTGDTLRAQARALLEQSAVSLTPSELQNLRVLDYGLGHPRVEGLQNITLLVTERLEVKVQILLPGQTVPEHLHPPYDHTDGKEENIRVVRGSLRVYLEGPDTMREGVLPAGKGAWYTVRNERILGPGQNISILPGRYHWFQGGSQGVVALSFYTRADNTRNRYRDPGASFPSQ